MTESRTHLNSKEYGNKPSDCEERVVKMDAVLFAKAFKVALLQMSIVGKASRLSRGVPPSDAYRYNNAFQLRRAKLVSDRTFVEDILKASIVELRECGKWESLQKATDLLEDFSMEAVNLRVEHQNLRRHKALAKSELKQAREDSTRSVRRADQQITFLRDKKMNEDTNARLRQLYVDKWLTARQEVWELRVGAPKPTPAAPSAAPGAPGRARPSETFERRVHEEMERFYEMQIREREELETHWRAKYAEDMTRMRQTLAERREQLQQACARRQELQSLYNLHEGELRGWLTFKAERAARVARERRARAAALRLQAWWRGLMVRRGLGAFRNLRSAGKKSSARKKK